MAQIKAWGIPRNKQRKISVTGFSNGEYSTNIELMLKSLIRGKGPKGKDAQLFLAYLKIVRSKNINSKGGMIFKCAEPDAVYKLISADVPLRKIRIALYATHQGETYTNAHKIAWCENCRQWLWYLFWESGNRTVGDVFIREDRAGGIVKPLDVPCTSIRAKMS